MGNRLIPKMNIWLGYHFKDGKNYVNEAGDRQRFFSWNNGEPNNSGGKGSGTEQCVELLEGNKKANDIPCGAEKDFLCEKPKSGDVKRTCNEPGKPELVCAADAVCNNHKCKCDEGFVGDGKTCNDKIHSTTPKKYNDAVADCNSKKKVLAYPRNAEDWAKLQGHVKSGK